MKAEAARFAVLACFALFAGVAWFRFDGWTAWIVCVVILAIGAALAERIFRRLATLDDIRADLEERTRSGP